ncbi:MAG: hypothetical protein LBF76_01490 [Holosporales bacterium]|jgi:hypothetical protein|nr:hypothetical protein [Holosporales bacterium]
MTLIGKRTKTIGALFLSLFLSGCSGNEASTFASFDAIPTQPISLDATRISVQTAPQAAEGSFTGIDSLLSPPFPERVARWAEKNLVAGGLQGEIQALVEEATLNVFPVAEAQGFLESTFSKAKVQYAACCTVTLQKGKRARDSQTYRVKVSVNKITDRDLSPEERDTLLRMLIQEALVRLRAELIKNAHDLVRR